MYLKVFKVCESKIVSKVKDHPNKNIVGKKPCLPYLCTVVGISLLTCAVFSYPLGFWQRQNSCSPGHRIHLIQPAVRPGPKIDNPPQFLGGARGVEIPYPPNPPSPI